MPHHDKFTWTPDRISLLKKLWSEGITAAQIALTICGTTRNSVLGKVHRLNLERRAKSPVPHGPRSSRPSAPPKVFPYRERRVYRKPSNPALTGVLSLRPISPRAIHQPPRIVPAGVPVGILDVTGCKYAVGEDRAVPGTYLFCNAPRPEASSWCDHHRPLLSRPWERRATP